MKKTMLSCRVIALPVETKVRELDGKVWLGYNLARYGAHVVIGDLSQIKQKISFIKPDIYIGDSAVFRESRRQLYRLLQEFRTKVVVLDTEGGLYYSSEMYLKRLSPEILRYVDLVLSWGEATDNLFKRNRKNNTTESRITGNPCFDLLMPSLKGFFAEQTEYLKNKYHNFILINTKFGRVNHFNPDLDIKKLLYDNPEIGLFQKALFAHFNDMIREVGSQYPALNIIVRPHPSENHDVYRKLFKGIKNIHVEHWWSVHPWALAAKAVIHNGCTTGIESRLLGKPVISFRPIQNAAVDLFIPNAVSKEVFSTDELIDTVKDILDSDTLDDVPLSTKEIELLEKNFHHLDGYAATRVCEALGTLLRTSNRNTIPHIEETPGTGSSHRQFRKTISEIKNLFQKTFVKEKNTEKRYREQKFSTLGSDEITSILSKISETNNHQESMCVKPVKGIKNTFWLFKRN